MEKDDAKEKRFLFIIKGITVFYIIALFFWGVTAFPLESEVNILCQIMGISTDTSPDNYEGLKRWIATINEGLTNTNRDYPFMAYGTDWLAFSHLAIAVAFIGVYVKPIRNKWIVYFGMIACVGIIPLAMICGSIRSIPLYWRLIDCSFCLFGLVPLYLLHIYINKLEKLIDYQPTKY